MEVEAEHPTLEIKKGDNIAKVKQLLGLGDPERLPEIDRVVYYYHLPELGFWIFFDETGEVYSIRFEEPYPYPINGIYVGDTKEDVLETLGKPQRYLPVPDNRNRWLYDLIKLRVDFNIESEEAEKIFRV